MNLTNRKDAKSAEYAKDSIYLGISAYSALFASLRFVTMFPHPHLLYNCRHRSDLTRKQMGVYMAHIISPDAEELLDKELQVHKHGFVRLVDYMGSDQSIVQAARVSYGEGTKSVREDRGRIR